MKLEFKRIHMNSLTTLPFTGLTALLVGSCVSTTTAPSARPAATARIQEWSAAYYGSAISGRGILNFNGDRRSFSITGLGAGGAGGQKVSARAKIYNLNKMQNFAGIYNGVSNGMTLIEGTMHAKLTNDNGVVMYLTGETQGLASSVGVQKFRISFTD